MPVQHLSSSLIRKIYTQDHRPWSLDLGILHERSSPQGKVSECVCVCVISTQDQWPMVTRSGDSTLRSSPQGKVCGCVCMCVCVCDIHAVSFEMTLQYCGFGVSIWSFCNYWAASTQLCISDAELNKLCSEHQFWAEMPEAKALADLRGAPGTRTPPWGSKFFHFHAVFGNKIEK